MPWPTTFDTFETTTGTYVDAAGFGTWTIGVLAPGESVALFVYATAVNKATNQVSTATISGDAVDPDASNNLGEAFFTVLNHPPHDTDIEITKSVDNAKPGEGDTIVYTVNAANLGPADATNVNVRDDFPADVTYVSDDSGAAYDPASGIWTAGDISNGNTATLQITATVDVGTAGSLIKNVASLVFLDQNDPNPDNDIATIDVQESGADIGVTKTVDDTNPSEGDTIDYTISVTNGGPGEATGLEVTETDQDDPDLDNNSDFVGIDVAGSDIGITKTVDDPNPSEGDTIVYTLTATNGGPDNATVDAVTDQLPTGLTYLSDDAGGDYNDTAGIWDIGNLDVGNTIDVLTITATVDSGTVGDVIVNTATITAMDQNDPNPDTNTDDAAITVTGADLSVAKTVDEANPSVGDTIVYTVRLTNGGPDDATGVDVTDQLPAGVTYVSDGTGGSYDPATGIWAVGHVANGDVAVAKILVTVDAGTSGSIIVNVASLTAADQDDPNPDNNTDRVTIIVTGVDLGLVKTVDNTTPGEGDTVVYSITFTNGGPKKATGVEVTDQLPAGVTYVADDSGGTYDPATGIWAVADLANGETATLQITATIDAGTTGLTITNTAAVTASDQSDTNPDNDTDSANVTVTEPANNPPSPFEPDDEGNLVPVDNVSDRIALGETPKALDIIDPEGDAFTVVIQTGELPAGVTMDDQGVFSGTATETGTFVLTMETCDDRTPQACSTFTYTLTVDEELPNTGIETTQIAIAGLAAIILGALMLVATSRRRDEDGQSVAR